MCDEAFVGDDVAHGRVAVAEVPIWREKEHEVSLTVSSLGSEACFVSKLATYMAPRDARRPVQYSRQNFLMQAVDDRLAN